MASGSAPRRRSTAFTNPPARGPAFLPRERHAGIHRRVRRDPVEDDQLVRAEPEQVLQAGAAPWTSPLVTSGSEAGIEGALSPQHPRGHLVRQPPVVSPAF